MSDSGAKHGADAARHNRKRLGFWGATALVFGNVVGSAIFILPASIAPFGWNAVIAWVIALIGALCLAWVFASMASQHPHVGGAHGLMQMGVGESAAFLGSWGYLASVWAANAAITVTGVSYLGRLVPGIASTPGAGTVAAVVLIWLFTWGNARALGGAVQMVSSVIKLLPFAAVIALGAWSLFRNGMTALVPVHSVPLSLSTTVSAIGITFFAMVGLESATVPSDAVEDAERTVPRATMFGTVISGVVTILSTCAVALMLPLAVVSVSKAPVADFIAGFWGGWAGMFVAFCGVFSCLGCLNGWLLVGAELPAAMCERGSLPPWFGVRNAHGVPIRSLLICACVTTVLTLLASSRAGVAAFNFAALLSTATTLVMYVFSAVTAIRLMRDGRLTPSPGLVVASVGATGFSVWAMYASGWEALSWGAVLLAFGWPLHLLARRIARAAAVVPAPI